MKEKQKDIIIANPMYDVVFKLLMMSDKNIAGYFVGTILDEEIIDIEFAPQDYPYKKQMNTENQTTTIGLVRLDFVATIRTKEGGEKKLLIEIQQSFRPADFVRFRAYLGQQYMLKEYVSTEDDELAKVLPIVVIYMLGFKIPEIPHVAVKICRKVMDLLNNDNAVECKSMFVDALTHDVYVVQAPRITGEMYDDWTKCSELTKLLSIFEQRYFVDEKFFKNYPYPKTDKNIKKMITTLEYIAADPKTRRAMEEEQYAALDEMIWSQTLAKKESIIAQQDNALSSLQNQLEEYQRRYGKLNSVSI